MRENFFIQGIRYVFTLDLRALALLRISLSVLLLLDLIFRLADLKAFYTSEGVLPADALFRFQWNTWYFSLFTSNDNGAITSLLFLGYFICICCLLLGFRTKLFTFIVWMCLISLHNRTPLVTQAGDHLLRMLIFWGMFLPWGNFLSLDASTKRRSAASQPYAYESFACLAYTCQVVFLYFFSAILKNSPEWRSEFTAIYYALSLDQLVRPVGEWLYPHTSLLKAMTAGVYYVELVLPLLLFLPFFNSWCRLAVIVGTVSLQLGIFATLNAGLFTATSILMMVGLLPPSTMDKIWPWLSIRAGSAIAMANRLLPSYAIFRGKTFISRNYSIFSESVVALALVYVLAWNMGTIGKKVIPDKLLWIGYFFKLEQHWAMFAPTVYKNDGWFIYQGTNGQGRYIDILREGRPVNYEKPKRVAELVRNDRWRKYGENILMQSNAPLRPYMCDFLLKEWNSSQPQQAITHLKIIYMHELTLPNYQTAPLERWELCTCSTNP
ncbi:MAG TPA: hypothetical protein VK014_04110 [Cyclobacteriaceae bacterium]|nr:hypothetical protein [Cyclobacteriaceae bacterium]